MTTEDRLIDLAIEQCAQSLRGMCVSNRHCRLEKTKNRWFDRNYIKKFADWHSKSKKVDKTNKKEKEKISNNNFDTA